MCIVVSIHPLLNSWATSQTRAPDPCIDWTTNLCDQGTALSSLVIFNKYPHQHMRVQKSARMDQCGLRWVLLTRAGAVRAAGGLTTIQPQIN